jgi:hypothetical protein
MCQPNAANSKCGRRHLVRGGHSKASLGLVKPDELAGRAFVVVFLLGSLWVIEPATAEGPWKGQVVDKETGKPLEGVVVLAAWYKA